MRSIIQRIATGPDLSTDISRVEVHRGSKATADEPKVEAGQMLVRV